MNQRIDQLWAQALDAAVPETYTRLSHSQVLKIKQVFADMIVKECGHCMVDIMLHGGIEPEQGYDIMMKRFGVEE
jgi:hypothetical protein